MRRIYVSCTNRVESPEDAPRDRGDAYVIDWDTKKVINHLDAYGPEDIEVGRSRGCAGIAWHDNKIYIACRSGLCVFDPDTLEQVAEISGVGHGIHEIKSRGGKLYITNTATDSFTVLENDEVVEQVYIREKDLPAEIVDHLNHLNRGVDYGTNRLHFNSLAWDGNGDMYHLYMSGGIVYNWSRKKLACDIMGSAMHHDLVLLDNNTFLTNGSGVGKTILIDIVAQTTRTVRKSSVGALEKGVQHGWLRGMALHKQTNTLFLTAVPGQLIAVDTNTWEDTDSMNFSTQPQEAPYGILLDPRDWRNEETTEWLVN
jgi:hypothetical protein